MVNMSTSNQTTPRSTMMNNSMSRSTIDDFREIIREQSFVLPNGSTADVEHIDVPVKKYPPLPDIAVANLPSSHMPFFRTEANFNPPKKQMFYHFARTQRGHLPSLNAKISVPLSISNVMDLDENLPECYTRIPHRAETYTSPNDRVSSPISRPSAPSPPASAQIKRAGHHAFLSRHDQYNEDDEDEESELDDLESQLFEENFYRYRHPMNNDRQNALLIYDDPTSSFNHLDLQR